MLKEHEWSVTVDGVSHTILCQVMDNKYVLWADDEHIQTIYRKAFQRIRGGIDQVLELWGKQCHFVVWQNEKVEFFLDGCSLSRKEADRWLPDATYEESRRRNDKIMRQCSWVVVIFMTLACIGYLVMALSGEDVSGWTVTFVGALVILIANLVSIFSGRKA